MDLPNDIKHLYYQWMEEEISKCSLRQQKRGMLYSKAIDSLGDYNEPILKPTDLLKVKFIGDRIVKDMAKILEDYCKENGYKFPCDPAEKDKTTTGKKRQTISENDGDVEIQPVKKKKPYTPKKGSGPYAIMLVLLEHDPDMNGMAQNHIVSYCSAYCASSFTKNVSANQMYSAWDGHKILLNHSLLKKSGRPAKYHLTEDGVILAQSMKKAAGVKFANEMTQDESQQEELRRPESNLPRLRIPVDREEFIYDDISYHFWEPKSFEIIFIVDNREIRAKDQRDYFAVQLRSHGIKVESRALAVGDGLWIARNKATGEEAVLDYIFERKRLDDLASSIKDGRYLEQKTRLKRTGIENVFYLIEEVTASDVQSMADAIQTSMSMAMTNSNFHLKRTKDADDTILFIKRITLELEKYYENIRLLIMDPDNLEYQQDYKKCVDKFRAKFNNDSVKSVHKYHTFDTMLSKTNLMTAREMFVRMLMTIRGISLEKASAIQKEFKTPRNLIENFDPTDPEVASKYGKKVQELIHEVFQK